MSQYAVRSKILKCIDDEGYPSFVECEFKDASGTLHRFQDKDVIFTIETLDRNSNYPQDGSVDCEIVEKKCENGRNILRVDTERPSGIESTTGETMFEVLEEQIVEIERSGEKHGWAFVPIREWSILNVAFKPKRVALADTFLALSGTRC